jgi:small subunit ribosomal protein S8
MSMTDPIADMLTRVRNATVPKLEIVDIPRSNMKIKIAGILKREGFIKDYTVVKDEYQGVLRIEMGFSEKGKKDALQGLKRISKPGRRVYVSGKDVPKVLNGLGIAILSTNKGVLTDKECRKIGVGGEVLCHIW